MALTCRTIFDKCNNCQKWYQRKNLKCLLKLAHTAGMGYESRLAAIYIGILMQYIPIKDTIFVLPLE